MGDEHILAPDFDVFVTLQLVDDKISELVVAVHRTVIECLGAVAPEHCGSRFRQFLVGKRCRIGPTPTVIETSLRRRDVAGTKDNCGSPRIGRARSAAIQIQDSAW